MKLNIEFKPKEWLLMALFVTVVLSCHHGDMAQAIELIKYWIGK